MTTPIRVYIKNGLWIALVLSVCAAALFAFRGVILPPTITVEDIFDGAKAPSGMLRVHGSVTRARELYINGIQVNQSETGTFSERVPTFAPYTIIEIVAKDAFGKKTVKRMTLVVE